MTQLPTATSVMARPGLFWGDPSFAGKSGTWHGSYVYQERYRERIAYDLEYPAQDEVVAHYIETPEEIHPLGVQMYIQLWRRYIHRNLGHPVRLYDGINGLLRFQQPLLRPKSIMTWRMNGDRPKGLVRQVGVP